jgi:GDP-L-fucose synthase
MNKRVLVLGGTGFLGRNLTKHLDATGEYTVYSVGTLDVDMTDQDETSELYDDIRPDIIINAAATVGGIRANMRQPAEFFYKNALMCINAVHEASLLPHLDKFVQIGTICSYGDKAPVPFKEDYLFCEYPSETNSYYGIAKLSILSMLWAYRKQYKFNGVYLLPVNMYGPHDNFDDSTSHVIPALLKKIYRAKRDNLSEVVVWGTGQASREFLYVNDCCEAIRLAVKYYNGREPVNVGTGQEICICDLAQLIADKLGYTGRIVYDTTKPDGQMRRCLDVSRAKTVFGFEAQTNLSEGLSKTINWLQDTGLLKTL